MRHRTRLQATLYVCLLASGCDSSDSSSSPKGATAVLGATCSEAEFKANTKLCSTSGDTVLECYGLGSDPAVPPYTWNLDKDCKASGKVCVSGACAQTGGGGPKEGDPCTEAEYTANIKPCSASGDTVLECYGLGSDPAVPPYTWNLDKDCKASGQICVASKCAAP